MTVISERYSKLFFDKLISLVEKLLFGRNDKLRVGIHTEISRNDLGSIHVKDIFFLAIISH